MRRHRNCRRIGAFRLESDWQWQSTCQTRHGQQAPRTQFRRPQDCALASRQRNPDASLSVLCAHANDVGEQHDDEHPRGCAGSAARPGKRIAVGVCQNTHRRNTGCRDHTAGRCAPAERSRRSCRADRRSRSSACGLPKRLDNATQHRHKGLNKRTLKSVRGRPGVSAKKLARAFVCLASCPEHIPRRPPPPISPSRRHPTAILRRRKL